MNDFRVIPVLLLNQRKIVQSTSFKNHQYIGDPLNIVRILNEKCIDELFVFNIDRSTEKDSAFYNYVKNISKECSSPLCFGGNITTINEIETLLNSGVDRISLNSVTITNPNFVKQACEDFGSSTITATIDYKKNFWGKQTVFINNGSHNTSKDPIEHALYLESLGVGEIILSNISLDSSLNGLDIELISLASQKLSVPVIAKGGVGNLTHIKELIRKSAASGVAAGSFFVYKGTKNSILINYLGEEEKEELTSLYLKNF